MTYRSPALRWTWSWAIVLGMCLGTPWFAQIAAADDGPPLFARITVLQTQGIEAPVDVVLTVQKIHRSPWGSDGRAAFGKLPIGQPSPWVDITEAIANARDASGKEAS